MNQGNCQDYNSCVQSELEQMLEPTDQQSLYANRLYDTQVANNICYNSQNNVDQDRLYQLEPFASSKSGNLREPFDNRNYDNYYGNNNTFKKIICFLISVVAFILFVVLACSICKKSYKHGYGSEEIVRVGIPTETPIMTSPYPRYQ